jgi:hypothetical protein
MLAICNAETENGASPSPMCVARSLPTRQLTHRVMHMLEPPAALTSPKMLLKLLVHTIRTALGGGGSRQGAGTA